jgi:hypothetical protein
MDYLDKIKRLSQLLFAVALLLASISLVQMAFWGRAGWAQGNSQNNSGDKDKPYEVPRSRLKNFQVFSYGKYLGLYEPDKGQIYLYKENIYVKTLRIADPGANLMVLY